MATKSTFIDSSTECAICFESLDDDPERTIILACGHRWHFACLKEQLESAQPSRSKRLVFSGTRCAKCAAFCDHPQLENLTRRTDALRGKVDGLIAEQLKADTPEAWEYAANDADSKARLIDEGRRSYAFYLCGGCDEPYFGGTVSKTDEYACMYLCPPLTLTIVIRSSVPTKMMESSLHLRIGSVNRAHPNLRLYANTHLSTDLSMSGNADTVATHRGLFVMAMFTFATIVMIKIHNEVGGLDLRNWRQYHAVGAAVYFLSPRDANDIPMVRLWILNRFITVLYVIHLHLATPLKSSLDQETL